MHLNPYSTEADYRELVDRLLADPTGTVRRETRLLRKDGTEVPVEKTYRAGPPGRDGTRWIVALARDITERLAADEALRTRHGAFASARQAVFLAEDHDRLARDLHDTVIQRLFAAGLSLQAVAAMSDDERVQDPARDHGVGTWMRPSVSCATRSSPSSLPSLDRAVSGADPRRDSEASASLPFEPRIEFDGAVETHRRADHRAPATNVARGPLERREARQASSVRVSVSRQRRGACSRSSMTESGPRRGVRRERHRQPQPARREARRPSRTQSRPSGVRVPVRVEGPGLRHLTAAGFRGVRPVPSRCLRPRRGQHRLPGIDDSDSLTSRRSRVMTVPTR